MKKPVRLLLYGTGLLVAGLLLLVGLAFHSGVQTWAARRALAGQPQLQASVGKVSAGFQTVELNDLRFEQDGAVITLPSVVVDFSALDAGLSRKFNIRHLTARGWTLDLTRYRPAGPAAPKAVTVTPAAAAPAAMAAMQVFQGVFTQASLPFDFTLDQVELEGEVKLAPTAGMQSGLARLVMSGGGLAAGKEGAFSFTVVIALAGNELPVSSLTVTGRLAAAMDTPRTFVRLATHADASARGTQFPDGVKLTIDTSATRTGVGENYTVALSDGARLLTSVKADLPTATHHLTGTWKLDVRDADLSPFALGRSLPAFALMGEGGFDFDLATNDVRGTGKLDASAGKLGVIKPELAALGLVKVVTEFDLARHGDGLRVERLAATFSGGHPLASIEALQPFEFNARSGELKVADPSRDLLGLDLRALPLAWAKPWLKDVSATGGDLRGEFVAIARNGGFSLRSKGPLSAPGLTVGRAGQPLVQAVDVSLTAAADYTPQGWQVEIASLVAKSGVATVLSLEGRAGQLLGPNQPVKATGKFSADVPALLAQPAMKCPLRFAAGEVSGDFVASANGKKEISAKLALANLAADPKLTTEKLPALRADLRVDVATGGVMTLSLPLEIDRDGRKSDLAFTGTLTPGAAGLAIDAHLSSKLLVVDDAQVLAGAVEPPSPPAPGAARPAAPWAGLSGQVVLGLQKVIYSDSVQLNDVAGTLTLEHGVARLVKGHSRLKDGAEAKIDGDLTFDAKAPAPYGFSADLAVDDLDAGLLFRAVAAGRPVTMEGKFSLSGKLSGRASAFSEFSKAARGDLQIVSKGGVFRGLPGSFSAKVEPPGKIAQGAAAIGSFITSMTGKKDELEFASRAHAVAEVAKTIAGISYDQLNVVLSRDAAQNTLLKDFALISPELRLTGSGQATLQPGAMLLDQPVSMDFQLRARGRTAEVMKYLGRLDGAVDDLGYTSCNVPLKVTGTLRQPDPKDLNAALAQLALEKPGVTEKASELINKLLGGK